MSGVHAGGGMSSWTLEHYYYYIYLFIWRPTAALHLRASAGKKTGFGARRKCKSDAPDAEPMCVGGDDNDDDDD